MNQRKKNTLYMIFYHNAEPNEPKELANSVQRELGYFNRFLLKAIDNMDVERYAIEWEKDKDMTYSIYPTQILKVDKPKNRIKLKIDSTHFSTKKVIMDEDGEQLSYDTFEKVDDGVILSGSIAVSSGETLYYGLMKVDWESLSSGFTGKLDSLEDRSGKKYRVHKMEEKADAYLLHMRGQGHVKEGIELFANDMKIDYCIYPMKTLQGVKLYDNNDSLKYSIIKEFKDKFIIHTGRKIAGQLFDNTGRTYFNRLDEKKQEDGVWIVLKEPEEEQISAEEDQRTKMDLFFELISASMDFEVWENSNPKKNGGRIRIKRADYEENRLLLEREPKTKQIYPPKSTYQLTMQKNAIQTLMFRPAPDHRNLLRLFETYDKTEWYGPTGEYTHCDWEFLEDIKRKGTDEQRDFVLKALNSSDFAILEGPPGSGKTTAISELIYQLLAEKKRILLSASTHVAVDNVLEKFEEKYRDSGGLMENGIVPLRIGREESVSEDVVKYQIEKRKEKIEQRIKNERWYKEATEEDKQFYLEEAVINSSNLICGTTIGILQYPRFKQKIHEGEGVRRTSSGNYVIPEFDYLIIDEASKTTFQEFLVPAIYAKKWVVVGDIRQLSPYTDTLHVRVNLDGVMGDAAKERALVVFFKLLFGRSDASVNDKWIDPPRFIYVDRFQVINQIGSILPDKIERELKYRTGIKQKKFAEYRYAIITNKAMKIKHEQIEKLDEEALTLRKASLFDKDIIFVDEEIYRKKMGSFPHTHILIHTNAKRPDVHEYRHLHWYMTHGKRKYAYALHGNRSIEKPYEIKDEVMDSIRKNWAGELSWRMKRVHELSMADLGERGGSKKFYEATMHALMPPDIDESRTSLREIRKIGQVSLTSILSSIQEGVTQDWRDEERRTVMSHGFMDLIKETRYAKITYQHRMHPEISALSREIFYKGEALQDDEFVKTEGRKWKYSRYKSRVIWLDVYNANVYRNTNENEAKVVLLELEHFISWAKEQKNKYNVVILSFYERQRKLIRDLLRQKYPENRRKETRFDMGGIKVRNYTVDKVQGRESDLVILSMVQNKRVGFMDSPNRLNVALTRAKYQLLIVGDNKYFKVQSRSKELKDIAERSMKINYKG